MKSKLFVLLGVMVVLSMMLAACQPAAKTPKWAIGVDSDQAIIIKGTNPDQAKVILTSMMKNVDNSLYRALKMHMEGKLPYGTAEALGVAEGGVGLARNEFYDKNTPDDVKKKIEQAEKDLLDGKIKVDTVLPPAVATVQAAAPTGQPAAKGLKVVNLINGVLGDKSFFDSADRGVQKAAKEFGLEVKTIEAGVDPAKWQPALEDAAANEQYDIMILGTYQMSEFLEKVAPKYADKKFIIYDVSVVYDKCSNKCANVYSVTYLQNEGSYLAGLYAGLMSKSKVIGTIGGQDIPVINDFIAGYKQGAKAAGVDKVLVQYAGGWNDPAKGKELALAMYQQGADVVFQVAGGTGVGVFQAAQEQSK